MKAARSVVDQRKAELLADDEAQLSASYKQDHELWAEITRQARAAVEAADARIAANCREHGIREDFRPRRPGRRPCGVTGPGGPARRPVGSF